MQLWATHPALDTRLGLPLPFSHSLASHPTVRSKRQWPIRCDTSTLLERALVLRSHRYLGTRRGDTAPHRFPNPRRTDRRGTANCLPGDWNRPPGGLLGALRTTALCPDLLRALALPAGEQSLERGPSHCTAKPGRKDMSIVSAIISGGHYAHNSTGPGTAPSCCFACRK